jgi:dTDP-4-amino-4,6-dideoxygalactose transaminase
LYVVTHPERDRLRQALAEAGIETALHYPIPLHLQLACAHLGYHTADFPVAEQAAQECLSLPLYPELTEEEQSYIVQIVKATNEKLYFRLTDAVSHGKSPRATKHRGG